MADNTDAAYVFATAIAAVVGFGDVGGTSDWPVFVQALPSTPTNCVGVFGAGTATFGQISPANKYYQICSLRIQIRGNAADHSTIQEKWELIKGLIGYVGETVGGYTYLSRHLEMDLEKGYVDDNNRDVWIGTINVHRQKA